jgi:hypothetical protein
MHVVWRVLLFYVFIWIAITCARGVYRAVEELAPIVMPYVYDWIDRVSDDFDSFMDTIGFLLKLPLCMMFGCGTQTWRH